MAAFCQKFKQWVALPYQEKLIFLLIFFYLTSVEEARSKTDSQTAPAANHSEYRHTYTHTRMQKPKQQSQSLSKTYMTASYSNYFNDHGLLFKHSSILFTAMFF